MAVTVVPSVMVNLEALNHDNYEHWSFRVKTYLMAEGLWDVVQGTDNGEAELKNNAKDEEAESKAWQKNNAKALHAIHISCGKDAESSIRGIEKARDAWNELAREFKPHQISEISGESSEVDPNDGNDSIDGDSVADVIEVRDGDQTYAPFFEKVKARRWEGVKEFIGQHPEAARARLPAGRTALSDAVSMEDVEGVKVLLPFMKETDLEILGDALSTAIKKESDSDVMIEITRCIVEKNEKLLLRHDPIRGVPLWLALHGNKPKMVHYLKSVTPLEKLKRRDGAELISTGLRVNRFDISLELLQQNPKLGIARGSSGESPLYQLANTRARLFRDDSQLRIWERWIYKCISIPPTPTHTGEVSIDVHKEEKDQGNQKHLIRKVACFFRGLVAKLCDLSGINRMYEMKLLHHQAFEILDRMCEPLRQDKDKDNESLGNEIRNFRQRKLVEKALLKAVERGHAPIISHLLKSDRSFCLITNEHKKTIFQLAAEHRQENIFNLLYEYGEWEIKDIVGMEDKFGDNMLHAVGKFSLLTQIDHIRGPALQMQKELQWFKKVERMARPRDLDCMNSDGRTPREVFTICHRDLVEAGEKSMKETATSSSTLVAALIITIMFAAAVTVPGGIKGDTGIPIYLHTKAFRTFMVADVISLCFSTTSVMVFLGILTSRFAEKDFLIWLPTKLIIGFLTLFLSIWAMMIAFSSAIFIMLPEKPSIVILSSILATFPIASFLLMQFPFLYEIIISTFRSSVSKRNVPKFEL
ncbi:uncharacterized protein LOC133744741 [Rosa rugosa]|uniref:uncharacterized protein LOC133744741 n=1 Tax=Rosa rugosa TaxID=74645 RepID=UPI002B415B63|nr:uncharacterized protein LOC133744741 [Rosa rugosa]